MKSTEELEREFWQLRVDNQSDLREYQNEIFRMGERYNSKLTRFLGSAIAILAVLATVIGLFKIF